MSERPKRRGELRTGPEPGQWVVIHPDSEESHLLNSSARAIWEMCDGVTTNSEMAEAISELTGISVDRARDDVDHTLDKLKRLGLTS